MRRSMLFVALTLPLIGTAIALGQAPKPAATGTGGVDRARLEQVIAAWTTMDAAKAAPFYAKDAGLAHYDIAPRKYAGWAEYAKGSDDMFKTLKSLTMTLNPDAVVHHAGTTAWATATVDGEMVAKDGTRTKVEARWTSIWEKRGGQWLIVHDHFSMPMPEPPPAKPTTK